MTTEELIASLKQQRDAVLRLATLYSELRNRVKDHLREKKLRIGEFASFLGVSWTAVKKLADGEQVICRGETFEKICDGLKLHDLQNRITALTKIVIRDARRGLAAHPADAINLVFDLEEDQIRSGLNVAEFAGLFGEDEELVQNLLSGRREALLMLRDQEISQRILELLISSEWNGLVEATQAAVTVRLAKKASLVTQAVQNLIRAGRASDQTKAAKLLGVHRTTLRMAMRGEAGEETLDQLLTRANDLLSKETASVATLPATIPTPRPATEVATPLPRPAAPAPAANVKLPTPAPPVASAAQTPPTILSRLEDAARGISPLGVRCVLTTEAWQEIQGELGDNYRDTLIRAFEQLRCLLALQIQHMDPQAREQLMRDRQIAHEIDELTLQLRMFSDRHPTHLLSVNDRQRASFVQLESERRKPS